jgi:hypothetical protein
MAPWVLTTGASTTDRMIKATAKAGNPYAPMVYSSSSRGPSVASPLLITLSFLSEKTTVYTGDKFAQGYLKWISSKYSVRSPIAVMFDEADA